jgi:hypothetical protein
MSAPKTMSGARAKFGVIDPATGEAKYIGIFNNVSYGLTYDAQPVYILGRYSPAEIDYTAQEPVSITASGWRVIDHGAHVEGKVPKLQDLLNHEYLTLTIVDRQNPTKNIATFRNVRPTGYSTTISARNLEEISVSFVGIFVDDESTVNAEDPTSIDLP